MIDNSILDSMLTWTISVSNPRRVRWLNGRQFSAWQASKVLGEARDRVGTRKKPMPKPT